MGLFGKRGVPDELPSLAVDEVSKSLPATPVAPQAQEQKYKSLPKQEMKVSQQRAIVNSEGDKGYFKELVKSVTEGEGDAQQIETWYKNEFLPRDMVFQMREYWQKQQPEILMKNVSGELKDKLMNKTEHLHNLEKEWQEIYFNLLSKEEEIRKQEKELKESLSEFVSIAKSIGKDRK